MVARFGGLGVSHTKKIRIVTVRPAHHKLKGEL